jgi:hypothetical protein
MIRETLFSKIYRACKEWNGWTGKRKFFERVDLVRQMMGLTIEYGWMPGRGPGGLAYKECTEDFWLPGSVERAAHASKTDLDAQLAFQVVANCI